MLVDFIGFVFGLFMSETFRGAKHHHAAGYSWRPVEGLIDGGESEFGRCRGFEPDVAHLLEPAHLC